MQSTILKNKKKDNFPVLTTKELLFEDNYSKQFFILSVVLAVLGLAIYFGTGYDQEFSYFKLLAVGMMLASIACIVSAVLYYNELAFHFHKRKFYVQKRDERNPPEGKKSSASQLSMISYPEEFKKSMKFYTDKEAEEVAKPKKRVRKNLKDLADEEEEVKEEVEETKATPIEEEKEEVEVKEEV